MEMMMNEKDVINYFRKKWIEFIDENGIECRDKFSKCNENVLCCKSLLKIKFVLIMYQKIKQFEKERNIFVNLRNLNLFNYDINNILNDYNHLIRYQKIIKMMIIWLLFMKIKLIQNEIELIMMKYM